MSFSKIIFLLTTYKYFLLFPIVVIEGPIATVLAGFLSSLNLLNLFIAYIIIVIADLVGDAMYYAIGYYGRHSFIERWGKYVGISLERLSRLEKHFKNHSAKTLIVGKLSHVVGFIILIAAGVAKVPFWQYIWYNLIPTLPKSLILFFIGYFFGAAYDKINTYLDYTAVVSVVLGIIFLAGYFVIRNTSKKYVDRDLI